MELEFLGARNRSNHDEKELLDVVRRCKLQISRSHSFPIGVAFDAGREAGHSILGGIGFEVGNKYGYQYWAMRGDAIFFLLESLYEDTVDEQVMFRLARVERVAEGVLYCGRVYSKLGYPGDTVVSIGIRHCGLKGRMLGYSEEERIIPRFVNSAKSEVSAHIETSVSSIKAELQSYVMTVCEGLFKSFNFRKFSRDDCSSILEGFT